MNVWAGTLRYARLVVAAIVLVVGFASLVGLLDRVSWAFELADVSRLQSLVLLVAAALAALLLRRPNLATLAHCSPRSISRSSMSRSRPAHPPHLPPQRDRYASWSPTSRPGTPTSPRSIASSRERARTSSA